MPKRLIQYSRFLIIISVIISNVLAQQKSTLAILDFEGFGISQTELQSLTNGLRSSIAKIGVYTMLERDEMGQILEKQNFQITGCKSDKCAVVVGQMLGVDLMVVGTIGKLGNLYYFNLRRVDVLTGRVSGTASHQIDGTIDMVLGSGVENLANMITSANTQPAEVQLQAWTESSSGRIAIITEPAGAKLIINGRALGQTPLLSFSLPSTKSHQVSLRLEGYAPLDTSITVNSNGRVRLNFRMHWLGGWLTLEPNGGSTDNVEGMPAWLTPVGQLAGQIYIDGEVVDGTQYPRFDLLEGQHSVLVKQKRFFPFQEKFDIQKNRETKLSYELRGKSKISAVLMSTVIPGSGQIYFDDIGRGVVFLATSVVLGASIYSLNSQAVAAKNNYIKDIADYNNAVNSTVIQEKRQAAEDSYNTMEDRRATQTQAQKLLGLLWAVNMIEIVF